MHDSNLQHSRHICDSENAEVSEKSEAKGNGSKSCFFSSDLRAFCPLNFFPSKFTFFSKLARKKTSGVRGIYTLKQAEKANDL